jgi:hypothetical protein
LVDLDGYRRVSFILGNAKLLYCVEGLSMGMRNVALRVCSNRFFMPVAAAALSMAVFFLAGQPAAAQMALSGNAAVGQNGGAVYSIPIAVPPGTAGLAPSSNTI